LLNDNQNEEPMPRSQLFAGLNTEPNTDLERDDEAPTPLDQPINEDDDKVIEEAIVPKSEAIEAPAETFRELEPSPEIPEQELKPEPELKPETALAPVSKSVPKPEVKKAPPAPAPVEIRTPSMPVVQKETTAGEYYIQLASTKDKSSADVEWKKLSKKYSVISSLPYRVETADLGERGLFYRIQAGPMSRADAQKKCAAIKKINPNGCLVKK